MPRVHVGRLLEFMPRLPLPIISPKHVYGNLFEVFPSESATEKRASNVFHELSEPFVVLLWSLSCVGLVNMFPKAAQGVMIASTVAAWVHGYSCFVR